jgi:hypothetical protein
MKNLIISNYDVKMPMTFVAIFPHIFVSHLRARAASRQAWARSFATHLPDNYLAKNYLIDTRLKIDTEVMVASNWGSRSQELSFLQEANVSMIADCRVW